MELVRRETDYALRALAALARLPDREVVSARVLAAREELPHALSRRVLKRLAKAGILESSAGMNGGFSLSREPAMISVADVLAAVQGEVVLSRCVMPGNEHCCARREGCAMRLGLGKLQLALSRELASHSLAEFVA